MLSRIKNLAAILSPVALSNLYTMGCAAKVDPRQRVPDEPHIPNYETRLTRGKLALEELLEHAKALGFAVLVGGKQVSMESAVFHEVYDPDLEEIIDSAEDQKYVATGTELACGCYDVPHAEEVCRANNAKFPEGVATVNEHGKYQKPPGWTPPDHGKVLEVCAQVGVKLSEVTKELLDAAARGEGTEAEERKAVHGNGNISASGATTRPAYKSVDLGDGEKSASPFPVVEAVGRKVAEQKEQRVHEIASGATVPKGTLKDGDKLSIGVRGTLANPPEGTKIKAKE